MIVTRVAAADGLTNFPLAPRPLSFPALWPSFCLCGALPPGLSSPSSRVLLLSSGLYLLSSWSLLHLFMAKKVFIFIILICQPCFFSSSSHPPYYYFPLSMPCRPKCVVKDVVEMSRPAACYIIYTPLSLLLSLNTIVLPQDRTLSSLSHPSQMTVYEHLLLYPSSYPLLLS